MAAPTEVERSVAERDSWKIGYQTRQMGVAGPEALAAMALPPTAMVDADPDLDNEPPGGFR